MACVHCSESKNHLTKADRYQASAPERRGCDGREKSEEDGGGHGDQDVFIRKWGKHAVKTHVPS